MIVRLTYINMASDKIEEAKKIYMEKVMPVVKAQQGNTGVRLLQSTQSKEEFISMTEWASASDADQYESSGTYKSLVDILKDSFTSKPTLKTYSEVENKVAATT